MRPICHENQNRWHYAFITRQIRSKNHYINVCMGLHNRHLRLSLSLAAIIIPRWMCTYLTSRAACCACFTTWLPACLSLFKQKFYVAKIKRKHNAVSESRKHTIVLSRHYCKLVNIWLDWAVRYCLRSHVHVCTMHYCNEHTIAMHCARASWAKSSLVLTSWLSNVCFGVCLPYLVYTTRYSLQTRTVLGLALESSVLKGKNCELKMC